MDAGAHCSRLPRGTFVGIKGSCFLGHYSPEAGETSGKEGIARGGLNVGGVDPLVIGIFGRGFA